MKLENILVDLKSSKCCIGDFGSAIQLSENIHNHVIDTSSSGMGSDGFTAPEVAAGLASFTPSADVWSLGIILFAMAHGHLPWDNADAQCPAFVSFCRSQSVQERGKILFRHAPSSSKAIRSLIMGLLTVTPEDRLTLDEALDHEWLSPLATGLAASPTDIKTLPSASLMVKV